MILEAKTLDQTSQRGRTLWRDKGNILSVSVSCSSSDCVALLPLCFLSVSFFI